MRRLVLLTIALLLLASSTAVAAPRSSGSVEVRLRVAEGYYPQAASTGSVFYASEPCALRIPAAHANAYQALLAGRARRCISSFVAEATSAGHYLSCVNGRCEDVGFYWALYRNGELGCQGVDELTLAPDDEITFSWEAYPTALALAACEI